MGQGRLCSFLHTPGTSFVPLHVWHSCANVEGVGQIPAAGMNLLLSSSHHMLVVLAAIKGYYIGPSGLETERASPVT